MLCIEITAYFAYVTAKLIEKLKDNFFSVIDGYLSIGLPGCIVSSKKEILYRTWYHICISMNALNGGEIDLYVDGQLTSLEGFDSDCAVAGVYPLSSQGVISVGTNSLVSNFLIGYVADVRFYGRAIDQAVVNEAKTFGSDTSYTNVYESVSSSSSAYNVLAIAKSDINKNVQDTVLLYLNDEMHFEQAEKACISFGGKLYTIDPLRDPEAKSTVLSVTKSPIVEVWLAKKGTSCKVATISNSKMSEKTEQCYHTHGALCDIPTNMKYKLLGMYGENIKIALLPKEKVFEDDINLQILWKKEKINVKSTRDMRGMYESKEETSFAELMGRNKFIYDGGDSSGDHFDLKITLSVCNDKQFTCDDGLCIPLEKICDYHHDCEDFSDENVCNSTMERPEYYDKTLSGDLELKVGIAIELARIMNLNMEEGTITLDVVIDANWMDERATFYNIHKDFRTVVPEADAKFYWQPNIVMSGVINEHRYILSMAENPGKMFLKARTNGIASSVESREGKSKVKLYFVKLFIVFLSTNTEQD